MTSHSFLPFPHADISKTGHPILPPDPKSHLTLHIPILERLSPNTSSFPGTPIHCFYSVTNHPPIAESRSDIRLILPLNIALGRELAVQIVRAQTINALFRRPRAANLLTALPHQLRVVVCCVGIVDVVIRHFRIPPVDAGDGFR